MPVTKIFSGETYRIQVLDESGNADPQLEPRLSNELLERMYRTMSLCRVFDRKAIALQRQGRMYTYAPVEGQEAVQVPAAMAIGPADYSFPSYREAAFYIARGAPLNKLFEYFMGWEAGQEAPKESRDAGVSIPVGSQTAHAPGAAYAVKLRKGKELAITFFGDGASSQGDFHEALNFAAIYSLPAIFLCSNNQYAISTPRKIQTASASIAQKALAYGMDGIQVDGMDPLAVHLAVSEAAKKAREGKGPTLIEAICYRFGPHTTADDPNKYREPAEAQEWRKLDWPARFQKYLSAKGIWTPEYGQKISEDATKEIEAAVASAEQFRDDPLTMFDYVYNKPTGHTLEQRKELEDEIAKRKAAGLMR
ncbi:pyruvate dehydrogenase (acetyl-transferring) E1 component subunit alpha [Candidatus Micrarchaeota archaeon]|nr:pyruvate dehydrogenase (acetyl-transferring) E1 component subunit alpha [Candidatus Micrarchaeota archaeon]MBI5176827.1 pyruvate dehydrogenase (acetyl-transferring) E1 component subunit alpha [Candidatus Micrarchaeota archaeon]